MRERHTDVLIVGGGVGGCAAAMAVTSLGYRAILTEQTDWIGGQLTAQAVPPDEHRWIEQFGCTASYRRFRDGVRQYYRDHYPLTSAARQDPQLNPGSGFVSRVCHEPRVGLAVLHAMLAHARSCGRLTVLHRHKPVRADAERDHVRAVTLRCMDTGHETTIAARYVLDATELGDLLPMAGVEYVTGAESRRDTGELHALEGPAQPGNVQSFTWCFPMAYDPAGQHVIDRPSQYERWRDYVPEMTPPWPMRLLSWDHLMPQTLERVSRVLLPGEGTAEQSKWALWLFRRIVASDHYEPGQMPHEVTLVNWHMNDYWLGNVIDAPAEDVERHLESARQLSLSLLYWLQTEAPRPDGGIGYPGLHLRPDITGTPDGLAMAPYFRESRRIRAVFTVTEQHVGTEMRAGRNVISNDHGDYKSAGGLDPNVTVRAEQFDDSVGIGCYRIDLHPSTAGDNYIDISSLPFQIPLGALLPQRVRNLIPACKNIGTTHITNGCYRLHPVEWNIGEAAGALAAFCLTKTVEPHAVRERTPLLREFQQLLRTHGVELEWPAVTPV